MALVKILDEYDLQREFEKFDRDYFSLEGYRALLDLFEECDCGQNTDLDVIAICCEFTESDTEDIIDNYGHLTEFDEIGKDDPERLVEEMNKHTWAMLLDNGNIIYQDF